MSSLPLFAKAIAALVAPYILLGFTWAVSAGLDVAVPSPDAIETFIVSVLSAVAVWATRNRPAA